jgi:hypothetical protein
MINKILIAVIIRLKSLMADAAQRAAPDRREEGLTTVEWAILTVGAAAVATLVVIAYRAAANRSINLLNDGG